MFALSPAAVATPPAPTNLADTSDLLAVAYGAPVHEAAAALLPCCWIYREVGGALARAASADPLFARWIDTYAADEFGALVRAAREAADRTALTLGDAARAGRPRTHLSR